MLAIFVGIRIEYLVIARKMHKNYSAKEQKTRSY